LELTVDEIIGKFLARKAQGKDGKQYLTLTGVLPMPAGIEIDDHDEMWVAKMLISEIRKYVNVHNMTFSPEDFLENAQGSQDVKNWQVKVHDKEQILRGLITSGAFRREWTRDDVKKNIGEPDDKGGASRKYKTPIIWKYGKIEVVFASHAKDAMVNYVYIDNPHMPLYLLPPIA
jgi:hypothetical protein